MQKKKKSPVKHRMIQDIFSDLLANNRATVDLKVVPFTAVLKDDMVQVNIKLSMPMSMWYSILAKLSPGAKK